ncbi:DUF805 domain-containing protein [Apilactobacillus timberlakei]|uniref:DUF805 domain-containing protein n=1 Tax=Apilactobacillus timberlakei TaxID=2008380 RepID=UPI00112BE167|nr:DUF805 domain-containing protein [Apilactobacillus timberlakei]TPR13146.1 DUF805 domain-containing protein [Apilactobacillus timberlakei]
MVGLFESYSLFFKNYFHLSGKSSRSEYWFAVLMNFIIRLIISILIFTIYSVFTGASDLILSLFFAIIGLVIYELIILIPSINLIIRRYRDAGISPVWFIVTNFVPFVMEIFASIMENVPYYLNIIILVLLIIDFIIKIMPSKK